MTTLTHADAEALAKLLVRPRAATLAGSVAVLEKNAETAGRLIAAMLKQAHGSDRWELPEAP
jgi:hypothetical protein